MKTKVVQHVPRINITSHTKPMAILVPGYTAAGAKKNIIPQFGRLTPGPYGPYGPVALMSKLSFSLCYLWPSPIHL